MFRLRGWLVWGFLLSCLFLAACAGPMTQDESQPVAASTLVASATLEPTATATIPNTPTVTPSLSPTVTLEPTPIPPTPTPTEVPATATPEVVVQEFGGWKFDGEQLYTFQDGEYAHVNAPEEFLLGLQNAEFNLGMMQNVAPGNDGVLKIELENDVEWMLGRLPNNVNGIIKIDYLSGSRYENDLVESQLENIEPVVVLEMHEHHTDYINLTGTLVGLDNIVPASIQLGSASGLYDGKEVAYDVATINFRYINTSGEVVSQTIRTPFVQYDKENGDITSIDERFATEVLSPSSTPIQLYYWIYTYENPEDELRSNTLIGTRGNTPGLNDPEMRSMALPANIGFENHNSEDDLRDRIENGQLDDLNINGMAVTTSIQLNR